MRLPDFLVIGAMKSGTTSLYEDLSRQPGIFFPPGEKEPHSLVDDGVLTPSGRQSYARLYANATTGQLCGDASTGYAKRPGIPGVPRRAKRLLGPDLKAIYLVREPIGRTISQHYHEIARGEISLPLGDAIQRYPRLVDYSRYAYQLDPWLDILGEGQVRIVRFEDYIADRPRTIASLCRFLGVEVQPESVDTQQVFGRTTERSVPRGALWRLSRTELYRRRIRPLLPEGIREGLRVRLLPKPPPRPAPPGEATLRYLAEELGPEVEALQRIMGLETAPWDLEEAVRSHLASSTA